jgi:hypothetical protein
MQINLLVRWIELSPTRDTILKQWSFVLCQILSFLYAMFMFNTRTTAIHKELLCPYARFLGKLGWPSQRHIGYTVARIPHVTSPIMRLQILNVTIWHLRAWIIPHIDDIGYELAVWSYMNNVPIIQFDLHMTFSVFAAYAIPEEVSEGKVVETIGDANGNTVIWIQSICACLYTV